MYDDAMGYSVPSPAGYSYASGMPNGMGYCYDMPAYGAGGQPVMYVVVDLAAVLDAYSRGMMRAYCLGAQSSGMKAAVSSSQQGEQSIEPEFREESFIGIYDRSGYGVYNDQRMLEDSQTYWNKDTMQMQRYKTYDEALKYARGGIAMLSHVAIEVIPSLQHPLNWRQKVVS